MSKKATCLCLTGWGQRFDSLEFVFKESNFDPFFVSSIDYSGFSDVEKFFTDIKSQNLNPEIVIGWSLGGQLAIRLVEKKILNPKLLILIAPPFQMVKSEKIAAAMSQKTFSEFRANLIKAANQAMRQFSILISMNDQNAREIAHTLDVNDKNLFNLINWFDELKRFSCFDLDFSQIPRTLLFQGVGDMIIHPSQADYFKERIKNFRLEVFKNCGHAPHLSDIEKTRKIILEEISKL
ncbi:MAG: alpha/beta hydrolase [Proteobacteria bacterium]|nr:alpha/beta hydrolase [Pseudomonadota bacterium]